MPVQVNDKWRIESDGMNYMPERWDEGGKEVRNPKTGEKCTSQPKWVRIGKYYGTFAQALEGIIKEESHELVMEGDLSVNDYLESLENIAAGVRESVTTPLSLKE